MTGNARSTRRPVAAMSADRSGSRAADEWLTVDEACQIVKIGRRTFERYLAHGTGPRVKRVAGNGGPIRIRRTWLDEWMEDAV